MSTSAILYVWYICEAELLPASLFLLTSNKDKRPEIVEPTVS
jgi:hypothetical protein